MPTSREQYNTQGKSNNFIAAQESGKLTVGQAAKLLSKKLGQKITATQLEPLANEFHHAGRFGNNKAKRVFFLSQEQVDKITLKDIEEANKSQWGWILGFVREYGVYNRKRFVPFVAEVGLIPAYRIKRLGDKFHKLTEEESEQAKLVVGLELPPFCTDWRKAR